MNKATKPSNRHSINRSKVFLALLAFLILATVIAWLVVQRNDTRSQQTQQDSSAVLTDAEQFAADYPGVDAKNPFVYASSEDVISLFDSGTGLVYLGFTECPWCQAIAPLMEEAAANEKLEQLQYLNIREARESNDETYQQLVGKLSPYLDKDEDGSPRIYVPDVTALKDGMVVARFEMEEAPEGEMAEGPAGYWTEERKNRAVKQLQDMIRKTR